MARGNERSGSAGLGITGERNGRLWARQLVQDLLAVGQIRLAVFRHNSSKNQGKPVVWVGLRGRTGNCDWWIRPDPKPPERLPIVHLGPGNSDADGSIE